MSMNPSFIIASIAELAVEKVNKVKGNFMKLDNSLYMRDPMSRVRLSNGISMKDVEGELLG